MQILVSLSCKSASFLARLTVTIGRFTVQFTPGCGERAAEELRWIAFRWNGVHLRSPATDACNIVQKRTARAHATALFALRNLIQASVTNVIDRLRIAIDDNPFSHTATFLSHYAASVFGMQPRDGIRSRCKMKISLLNTFDTLFPSRACTRIINWRLLLITLVLRRLLTDSCS